MRKLAMLVMLTGMCVAAFAQDDAGGWLVRRARTDDADQAGGYPTWQVSLQQGAGGLNVDINEDPAAQNARGHILIVKRVQVPAEDALTVEMSYASYCAEDNRCGIVELVGLTPEQFEALGTTADTEAVHTVGGGRSAAAAVTLMGHVGDDVTEPVELSQTMRDNFAQQLHRFAGREMYVGVAWGGLHTVDEWGKLRGLKLATVPHKSSVQAFFERLDPSFPGLAEARAAWAAGDEDRACTLVADYFRTRTEPPCPFDRRGGTPSGTANEEALMALQDRFRGQGSYGYIQMTEPIDWSFNPVGDMEWPWQFNRHSAWQSLGSAYQATGEERFVDKWVELLRSWLADNPPGTAASWRTLEVGIRIPLWLGVLYFLHRRPAVHAPRRGGHAQLPGRACRIPDAAKPLPLRQQLGPDRKPGALDGRAFPARVPRCHLLARHRLAAHRRGD